MRDSFGADGLTELQRRFVDALRRGASGIDAARAAGYGGSDETLMVRASKLRRNPKIIAALERKGAPPAPSVEVPTPQRGPQTMFADCAADIALFGGAAGGGKTWSLVFEPVKWASYARGRWCLPSGMRVVAFRRTHPELMGGGGLWDESQEMYRPLGGRPRTSPSPDWLFPGLDGGNARVEFRHLHRDGDVYSHQGRQYAIIIFDELTHFTAAQFWYLVSRLRSTCGIKPYLRASCNPDPDSFVAELVAWWIGEDGYPIAERSGVLRWFVRVDDAIHWYDSEDEGKHAHPDSEPLSFTFIASRLADNRILVEKDPSYRAKLLALGRVERARLLGDEKRGGNWKVRASAGMVFRRADFRLADHPPSHLIQTVRFWDKASSAPTAKHPNPDWTRGPRVSLCEGGLLWIDDLQSLQGRPNDVLALMRKTGEHDTIAVTIGLWQDTGGAGVVDVDVTADALAGFAVEKVSSFAADTTGISESSHRSSKPKRAFAGAWAPWVEKGRVYVKRAPWTEELLNECDGFPDARFDDIVDGISGAFQVLVGQGASWWELIKQAAAKAGN